MLKFLEKFRELCAKMLFPVNEIVKMYSFCETFRKKTLPADIYLFNNRNARIMRQICSNLTAKNLECTLLTLSSFHSASISNLEAGASSLKLLEKRFN